MATTNKKAAEPLLVIPLKKAVHIVVALTWSLFTIAIICFLCFSRTADHLPALSETGIYPPQRYIFTLAMTIVGGGILALVGIFKKTFISLFLNNFDTFLAKFTSLCFTRGSFKTKFPNPLSQMIKKKIGH